MTSSQRREGRALDRHFLSGLAWTGVVKWGSQALSWTSTLIIARILSPDDYGIVGMTAVFMALVSVVSESGLGISVVNNRDLTGTQLRQLHLLCVLLGVAAFLLSCLAAAPLAAFFRVSELTWVVIAMSTTFLITSFRTVPGALLQRDLDFKTLALIEGLQSFLQVVTIVTLAVLGFRYWSLVIGAIAGAAVGTIAVVAKRRCAFAWPRRSDIGSAFRYGRQILGGQISWYLVSNSDLLIVGRLLGQSATGVYTLAFSIAATPVEKITSLVARVAFPMFSHVQNDLPAMRRYLLTLTEGLALVCFPLAIGLALEADRFVPVVLGPHWTEAVGPLRVLALLGALRSITPIVPHVLNAIGRQRFMMINGFFMAVLGPIAFIIGARQAGLLGVAVAWLVVVGICTPPAYWAACRGIHLAFRSYLAALVPALSACGLMAAAVLGTRGLTTAYGAPPATALLVEIGAGAAAYLGAVFLLHRRRLASIVSLLRRRDETASPGAMPAAAGAVAPAAGDS